MDVIKHITELDIRITNLKKIFCQNGVEAHPKLLNIRDKLNDNFSLNETNVSIM